jgi:uncharacterized protein (TIGR02145 family)
MFLMLPSCQKDESEQDYLTSPLASSNKGNPTATVGKVKDIDGNWYKTVKIGDQWWIAENLKTTKFNDKTTIPNVIEANLTTGAYCWYKNDIINKNPYGALYNFYAVNTGNLCPNGWHVPTDAEWTTLTTYVGGSEIAGDKLREVGTSHWWSPNDGATNEFGFTALPGGLWFGNFGDFGSNGVWWSASEYNSTDAYYRVMSYNFSVVGEGFHHKSMAFSVRCLKDQ